MRPGWLGPSQAAQSAISLMSVVLPPDCAGMPGSPVVVSRPLEKERIGLGRWTAIFLGLWGYYGKNDSVDVQYGSTVATGLEIIPPE